MERRFQESMHMRFVADRLPRVLVAVTFVLAVSVMSLVPANSAFAALLAIEFTGLDLQYDGTNIFDAGGDAGGDGSPDTADELFTMTFMIDGALVGTLDSDIYADVWIPDVEIPAAGGGVASVGGGFFDLLTNPAAPYFGASLPLDGFEVLYTGGEIAVFGTGVATAAFNDLPFGAEFVEGSEVSISFSTQINNLNDDGEVVTSFDASGTGEARGPQIPEPTTLLSLVAGLAALTLAARRR